MSITREEIRQLCIAHDRFMAEQASEPIRRPAVSERTFDNGALETAPQPEPVASDAEPSLADALLEFCGATDRRFERLERENVALKAKLEVVLTLLGQRAEPDASKSGSIVELPRRSDVA